MPTPVKSMRNGGCMPFGTPPAPLEAPLGPDLASLAANSAVNFARSLPSNHLVVTLASHAIQAASESELEAQNARLFWDTEDCDKRRGKHRREENVASVLVGARIQTTPARRSVSEEFSDVPLFLLQSNVMMKG
jgi:hypothetical protein